MNQANTEAQEEHAFDMMDELLEAAVWKSGAVVLKTIKTVHFCYDIPQLRKSLTELALNAVKYKFKQCDIDLEPVVQNIIEEYANELKKNRIFERKAPRFKRAQ